MPSTPESPVATISGAKTGKGKQRNPKKSAFSCETCRQRKVSRDGGREMDVLMRSVRSNALLSSLSVQDVELEAIHALTNSMP